MSKERGKEGGEEGWGRGKKSGIAPKRNDRETLKLTRGGKEERKKNGVAGWQSGEIDGDGVEGVKGKWKKPRNGRG